MHNWIFVRNIHEDREGHIMKKETWYLLRSTTRGLLLDYYNDPFHGEPCYVWSDLPPIEKITPGHTGPLPSVTSAISFLQKEDALRLAGERSLDDDDGTISTIPVRLPAFEFPQENRPRASIEQCAALGYGWRSENAPAFRNWPNPPND